MAGGSEGVTVTGAGEARATAKTKTQSRGGAHIQVSVYRGLEHIRCTYVSTHTLHVCVQHPFRPAHEDKQRIESRASKQLVFDDTCPRVHTVQNRTG